MVSFGMRKSAEAGGGRSSTASHFSKDYESVTAGVAANEFYGIPLSNDITQASDETLLFLAILILLVLFKPAIRPLQSAPASLAFWGAVLAAAYSMKEVTLYPLLSTIIFTRTSYPYLVVLPHCIVAAAAYRKERASEGHVHYLQSLGLGFFCFGFGGSIVSDVLMGLPATALGHARIVPCWITGWVLVWFSPFDMVYRLASDKNSVVHYFLNACETVDGVTTPMGRVSRSGRELQNKVTAPILAGVLAGTGGAAIRYCERVLLRCGGENVQRASKDALEAGLWKNVGYSVLWWYIAIYKCNSGDYGDDFDTYHCHEYNGNNLHRFVLVITFVVWGFLCDLGLVKGHPFNFIARILRNIGASLAGNLQYGPPQMYGEEKFEKLD